LILVATNAEVKALNRMAQEERRREGQLGGSKVRVGKNSHDKDALYLGTPYVKAGGDQIHEGDRLIFLKNSSFYGVKNSHLGTVVRIDHLKGTHKARLDDRRVVTVSLEHYGSEHIRLGYAVTSHKAQGATVMNSFVLVSGPMQDREISYVQASRAREETRLFTDRMEAGDDLAELVRQMSTSRQNVLAHDLLVEGHESNENDLSSER